MIDVTISNSEKIQATLTPTTKPPASKPAKLDGIPTWTVSIGDSTLDVAADGLSAFLVSSDSPGETVVLIEADADLGSGVITISDTIKLSVTGENAENLGVTLASAVPK